jgi:hypothetical protein
MVKALTEHSAEHVTETPSQAIDALVADRLRRRRAHCRGAQAHAIAR